MLYRLRKFSPPLLRGCAALAFMLLTCLPTRAQQSRFNIWKGSHLVGSIVAQRVVIGERTVYTVISYSEFHIVLKQVVRSAVSTEHRAGVLSKCYTQVTVNGSLRDSSHCAPEEAALRCFVHPHERFMHHEAVAWTTARMYFEEPVSQATIFVESVMRHCPLQRTGPGQYKLVLPGNKVNRYSYRDGRLESVHVDRGFFALVFRSVV